jgi:transcriptional regulator with XRE-family HTH domain
MTALPSRSAVAAYRRHANADASPLREARLRARLTQRDLARIAGVSARSVIRAESAKSADAVSRGTWAVLSDALNLRVSDIVP